MHCLISVCCFLLRVSWLSGCPYGSGIPGKGLIWSSQVTQVPQSELFSVIISWLQVRLLLKSVLSYTSAERSQSKSFSSGGSQGQNYGGGSDRTAGRFLLLLLTLCSHLEVPLLHLMIYKIKPLRYFSAPCFHQSLFHWDIWSCPKTTL